MMGLLNTYSEKKNKTKTDKKVLIITTENYKNFFGYAMIVHLVKREI